MLGSPIEVSGPVGIPDDGGNEEPGRPADGDEALSDNTSEDVELVIVEEMPELVTSPGDELEGSSLTPLDAELVGRLEMVLSDAELGGSVMETLKLSLLLRLGIPVDSIGVEVPGEEAGTLPSVEFGKPGVAVPDTELPDAVIVDSTSELTVLLTDPEETEDISLDAGLEVEREDGAETSLRLEDDPLGVGGPDTTALETGLLGDDELIVQVSTLVVVRSVIWEVERFVAIVVTRLVVIVMGRLEARLTVLELSEDSRELGPEDEGDAELSGVGGVDPDDDVPAGGSSEPDVVERLGELGGFKLDVAAEVETLDKMVPEDDDTAEEEASLELLQKVSASCHMSELAFTQT